MTHPAKPAPLEPRDESVWLALLAGADDRGCFSDSDPAIKVLVLHLRELMPLPAVRASIARILLSGRLEQVEGGLRIRSWREFVGRDDILTPEQCDAAEREWQTRQLEPHEFVKLYASGAQASPYVRTVWHALLVACDADGCVDSGRVNDIAVSIGGAAAAEAALEYLTRTGRIEVGTDGRVRIQNYRHYREMVPTGDTTNGGTKKGTREEGGSE